MFYSNRIVYFRGIFILNLLFDLILCIPSLVVVAWLHHSNKFQDFGLIIFVLSLEVLKVQFDFYYIVFISNCK